MNPSSKDQNILLSVNSALDVAQYLAGEHIWPQTVIYTQSNQTLKQRRIQTADGFWRQHEHMISRNDAR